MRTAQAEKLVRALRKFLRYGRGCNLKKTYQFLLTVVKNPAQLQQLEQGFRFVPAQQKYSTHRADKGHRCKLTRLLASSLPHLDSQCAVQKPIKVTTRQRPKYRRIRYVRRAPTLRLLPTTQPTAKQNYHLIRTYKTLPRRPKNSLQIITDTLDVEDLPRNAVHRFMRGKKCVYGANHNLLVKSKRSRRSIVTVLEAKRRSYQVSNVLRFRQKPRSVTLKLSTGRTSQLLNRKKPLASQTKTSQLSVALNTLLPGLATLPSRKVRHFSRKLLRPSKLITVKRR